MGSCQVPGYRGCCGPPWRQDGSSHLQQEVPGVSDAGTWHGGFEDREPSSLQQSQGWHGCLLPGEAGACWPAGMTGRGCETRMQRVPHARAGVDADPGPCRASGSRRPAGHEKAHLTRGSSLRRETSSCVRPRRRPAPDMLLGPLCWAPMPLSTVPQPLVVTELSLQIRDRKR